MAVQSVVEGENLSRTLSDLLKPASEIDESLLVSATYDGESRLAVLKFYDQKAGRVWLWKDNTGHRPYCVTGDTLLLGDNAPIAEIQHGNHVLGLSGEVSVEGKTSRRYSGEMVRIIASGLLPFGVTPEHPILAAKSKGVGHRLGGFEAPCWKLPSDLTPKTSYEQGDYLVMPVAKSRFGDTEVSLARYSRMRSGWLKVARFPLNQDTAWLLGLYVAEGSSGGRRGAVFPLNKREQDVRGRIIRIANKIGYGGYSTRNGLNSINVHIGGQVLARAFEDWCGRGAAAKKVPDFILFHSNLDFLKSFLDGYVRGDGSKGFSTKGKSVTRYQAASSTSRLLVLQLQQAFARLGIFAGIKIQHEEGSYQIEGRLVHQKRAYTMSFVEHPKYTRSRRMGDCFYVPIRKVEKTRYRGNVYNIQTTDSTYLVNNAVVHNCYTRLPMEELAEIKARKDVVAIDEEERLDLLNDQTAKLRKIVTTDPLAIGGGNDSIRDRIKAWEADIKYYENYAYDRGLQMGTYYRVTQGKVLPVKHAMPERVTRSLQEITKHNPKDFGPYLEEWAELLGEPLADFRRVAMDIEVANEAGRLPDAEQPDQAIIAVSFYNNLEKTVYLLRGGKDDADLGDAPYTVRIFDDEVALLRAVMNKMMEYPFLVTFNGDNFDLRYLKHRSEKVGIREDENPIQLERVAANLKHGVHVDLYQFFRNRSIQVYAFANKYTEHTLDAIAEAIVGESKLEFEGEIGDLPLKKLAEYCLHDSKLTYELTSMGDSLVMKLLLVIARIGRMPMNDVSRLGVSNWIRSMLFYEHRKMGALIPRPDELSEKGGASSQAIIKGKKYKGGLVIEPKPGVHFDVSVMDFASLYPSLIKVHNLSYETVNCPHAECRKNRIPDTESWECSRRKGITSLVIGSLRDLRVSHYKVLARDPTLTKTDRDLYNVVSQGLKVYLNAAYGSFGFESFAFYCLPVAEATAALGRYAITRTIEKAKELGIEVVYGDSVTGERCVTLLDPSGRLRVMPIAEFFESASPNSMRVDGKEEVYPAGWKALSVNPMTRRVEIKRVKAIIRHRTNKRIFRVREKWGVTRVTEDHSLLVSEGRSSRFASPLDIEGSHLVRADEIPPLPMIETIDVFEAMKHLRYPTLYKGRIKVSEAHADAKWVWFGWTNRRSQIKVKRKIKVGTPEFESLVELLGAYVPEGSTSTPDTTNSRFGASIANEDEAWLNQVKEHYLTLFSGAKASVIRSTKKERQLTYRTAKGLSQVTYADKTLKLQMMNATAAAFFKALAGQASDGKKIPDFVFNIPVSYQRLFIDRMVKGDGSRKFGDRYSRDYSVRNFRYETASNRLASGLSTLLTTNGIRHTVEYRPSKRTYRLSTSDSYGTRKTTPSVSEEPYNGFVYDLSVEDYHTFVDSCGSIVLKNTDSTFMRSPSKEQIETIRRWADSELGVELDLDKVYRYVAFSGRKKNYFGVLPDGTVDIRGLTGKKSQTPEYLKETFYSSLEILSRVQSPEDFEKARANIKELLAGMIANLKGKKVPVQKLAFNVMMGKPTQKYNGTTPQHVRAAKLLEEKGREVKAGEMIAYVKTKSPPYVRPVDLARVDDVDSDKYLEYAHSMFDQMLDALDFSFDEIMGATTLDFFWSN